MVVAFLWMMTMKKLNLKVAYLYRHLSCRPPPNERVALMIQSYTMNDVPVALVTVVVDDDSSQNRTDAMTVNGPTMHLPSSVESKLPTVPETTEEQQTSQVRCGWPAALVASARMVKHCCNAWSVVAEE
jgi:hypothetical protein